MTVSRERFGNEKPLWKQRSVHLLQFPNHKATEKENSGKNLRKTKEKERAKNPAVTANLSEQEEQRLLKTLKKHRTAIGYTLDYLKGISPMLCQNKINLEADAKPVRYPQRRLNPKMKEVVRKEILKLPEAGIIYPVADSDWVSPVHCVPKKGGITIVPNDKDELIPQRIITGYRMVIDFRK